jgi:heat shock protein HtpX
VRPMRRSAGSQATASVCIMHPFPLKGGLSRLFSTHPPTEERIRLLYEMAAGEQPRALRWA